ncbi:MAG: hypothetical protein WDN31_04775 [Hyphomicrobium sp.]
MPLQVVDLTPGAHGARRLGADQRLGAHRAQGSHFGRARRQGRCNGSSGDDNLGRTRQLRAGGGGKTARVIGFPTGCQDVRLADPVLALDCGRRCERPRRGDLTSAAVRAANSAEAADAELAQLALSGAVDAAHAGEVVAGDPRRPATGVSKALREVLPGEPVPAAPARPVG